MSEPERQEPDIVDVIVVGAGGSGLAAACSAAEHGGRVLLLEKQAQPGGTTGIAVGSFTSSGTSLQRDARIEDDSQWHAEDAAKFAAPEIEARNNRPLRAWFLQQSGETFEWLRAMGLHFVGPHPEPPNRVARMHNVVPGAKAYIAVLQMRLQQLGGRMVCDADVRELVLRQQRVVGVRASIGGQMRLLEARRAVILAAGDYAGDAELIGKYKGSRFERVEGINPHAGGDGHRLVEQAGGELLNMDITYGPELRFVASSRRPFQQWLPAGGLSARVLGTIARRLPRWVMRRMIRRLLVTWQHPENSLFEAGAILINRHGERFVNEKLEPERELAVARQPDKQAYILLDRRLVEQYSAWPHFISTAPDIAYAYVADYLRLRPDVCVRAEDLDALARLRDLPADRLRASVAAFNRYVDGSEADAWQRSGDAEPLRSGPWVLLGPLKSYFTTTEGGARINSRMQVLDAESKPIAGLFAVGQNGLGGMILFGHGLHIAWALTSGRLVGKAVMQEKNETGDDP